MSYFTWGHSSYIRLSHIRIFFQMLSKCIYQGQYQGGAQGASAPYLQIIFKIKSAPFRKCSKFILALWYFFLPQ